MLWKLICHKSFNRCGCHDALSTKFLGVENGFKTHNFPHDIIAKKKKKLSPQYLLANKEYVGHLTGMLTKTKL